MACALSLYTSGVRDIVIVEAAENGNGNVASRAIVVHAATLEVRSCERSWRSPFLIYHNRRWILLVAAMLWSNGGSRLLP